MILGGDFDKFGSRAWNFSCPNFQTKYLTYFSGKISTTGHHETVGKSWVLKVLYFRRKPWIPFDSTVFIPWVGTIALSQYHRKAIYLRFIGFLSSEIYGWGFIK